MLLFAVLNSACAQDNAVPAPIENGSFCLIAGTPPSDVYTVIKKVKLAKGSYGHVKDVLPEFVAEARSLGADAIINYAGTQRFGLLPWRMVRPVLRGIAVKWDSNVVVECEKMGGQTMSTVIATNRAPANDASQATGAAPEN